jgi:hypothetical protein
MPSHLFPIPFFLNILRNLENIVNVHIFSFTVVNFEIIVCTLKFRMRTHFVGIIA